MDELAKKFADLAEKFSPRVLDAAKEAAKVEAYSSLVGSLEWFVTAIVLLGLGKFFLDLQTHDKEKDRIIPWSFGAAFCFGLGGICLLPGIWNWIDPWTWTAISRPELWIAHKILGI